MADGGRLRGRRVGFVGLGVMGSRMAWRLLQAGCDLAVFDLDPAAAQRLTAAGAAAAASPAELAARSEVAFLSLPAAAHVERVLTGPEGLLEGARPGLTVADLSTIGPAAAQALAGRAAAAGAAWLDAPVGGGQPEAEAGTLVLMVGGAPEALAGCRDLLGQLGKAVFHFGGPGMGQAAKVALNLAYGATVAGAAEGVGLLRGAGADLGTFLELLSAVGASAWFQRPARDALAGRYEPGFRIDLMVKDLGLALEAGKAVGLELPMGELARARFTQAQQQGLGGQHTSALVELYRAGSAAGGPGGPGQPEPPERRQT